MCRPSSLARRADRRGRVRTIGLFRPTCTATPRQSIRHRPAGIVDRSTISGGQYSAHDATTEPNTDGRSVGWSRGCSRPGRPMRRSCRRSEVRTFHTPRPPGQATPSACAGASSTGLAPSPGRRRSVPMVTSGGAGLADRRAGQLFREMVWRRSSVRVYYCVSGDDPCQETTNWIACPDPSRYCCSEFTSDHTSEIDQPVPSLGSGPYVSQPVRPSTPAGTRLGGVCVLSCAAGPGRKR